MPALRLFDTAKGGLVTLEATGEQSMYVCGITPYDATHMGHAASYVAFDLLNRAWRDGRQHVAYVQNVTDVDDPLLERATATGVDWRELAASQIELFQTDMEALNVLAPDNYIGAVEAVPLIVPAIESPAAAAGWRTASPAPAASPTATSTTTSKPPGSTRPTRVDAWTLGSISGLSDAEMLELFAERGGDPGRAGKRQALDPLLWRVAREGEPSWPGGELGEGRPGWHIECTVIAQEYLPAPFTVQGGGSDLVFPHHEMGAGHAYSLTGVPLASHFAHAGMVGLDGEKMSKSKGNLVLVSRLRADGEEPAAIRLAILAHHYRTDWSWTDDGFAEAKDRLRTWREAVERRAGRLRRPAHRRTADRALERPERAPRPRRRRRMGRGGPGVRTAAGSGASAADAALVSDAVDALLGVEL